MELIEELWEQERTLVVIRHDAALARRVGRVLEIRDCRIVRDAQNEVAA